MGTTSPELFVELDRSRPRKLRAQVEDGLRDAIRCGRLAAGERLPSSRALAADLGITRGVVVDAYDQLAAEGYLTTVQGSGTRVNDVNGRHPRPGSAAGTAGAPRTGAPAEEAPGPGSVPAQAPPTATATGPATPLAYDFRSGLPDLGLFPRAAWARATRAALASMPDAELGYLPPAGLPGVRASIAAYLGRVRGVACTPDQVVMCNGFGHGFTLVLRALARRGVTGVAVEVPGYDEPRAQIADAGARAYPVPVDGEGISTEALAALPPGEVGAAMVTPAHQSPTGVVLSPARRTELVDWARGTGAYVIEDDYDAEYRYDRQPVGALQGVAPDRVVYQGTLSKSLAPGLRLGWLVAPPDLIDDVLQARLVSDHMGTSIVQATFGEFLERGDLDRHLRSTRRTYRERRDALLGALDRWMPGHRVGGVSAGLAAFVTLPPAWGDAARVVEAGRAAGVGVYQVPDPLMDESQRAATLTLGYGTQRPAQIRDGIRLLADAVAAA